MKTLDIFETCEGCLWFEMPIIQHCWRKKYFFDFVIATLYISFCWKMKCLQNRKYLLCFTKFIPILECSELKGQASGPCASGFGICCLFTMGCGETITKNKTHFRYYHFIRFIENPKVFGFFKLQSLILFKYLYL